MAYGRSLQRKTVTSGLKMLPSAYGLGQHFQDLGHSFSLYGPPSRSITYICATRFLPGRNIFKTIVCPMLLVTTQLRQSVKIPLIY